MPKAAKTKLFFRPTLQTLEDRLAPAATPFGPLHGYDGTWDADIGDLVVNVAQADGWLAGHTLSIATIVDGGNTFVTLNGDQTAVKANEVQSLVLTDADRAGVTFDLSAIQASDFSAFASDISVAGFVDTTLRVNNTPRLWTLDSVDDGSVSGTDYGIVFTNVSTIEAGTGADVFDFNDSAAVTGAIDAGTGAANTFDFADYTSALTANVTGANAGSIAAASTFNFTNLQNLIGGTGANAFDLADGGSLSNLDGGSGGANTLDFTDTLNSSIVVDLTAANAGAVPTTVTFTDIQTLNGSGAGGDTYIIENGASIDAINGSAAGNNTLSYPASTTGDVAVDLQAQTATGVGTFSNIDAVIIAASGSIYTLNGDDTANDWEILAPNAGNIDDGKFNFTGFTVLYAGSGGDAFTIDPNVVFAGVIHGGDGIDTLNLGSDSQTVTLTTGADSDAGFSGTASALSNGFTRIDVLIGTGDNNTLNGESTPANWNLADPDNQYVANDHTLTFTNFQNLNGGNAGDTFTCFDNFTGTLNGGTGANTFAFLGSAVLTGDIVGNTGHDLLDYSNYDLPIAVALTGDSPAGFSGADNAGSINGTFTYIDALIGSGNDADSVTGEDVAATWMLATPQNSYSAGADTLTFSNISSVTGGAGADTFNIGSSLAANNGNLDNVTQPLSIDGGGAPDGQRDTLYLNDHGSSGYANFIITPDTVTTDPDTTPRAFAGLVFANIDFLRLDGNDSPNVFTVTPSYTTEFFVNGNLPRPGTLHAGGGNILHIDTTDTTGARIHITSLGTGYWDFTSGQMRVDFISIGPPLNITAIGANAGSLPTVKVFNADTGALLFQFVAYENYFRGGVRVTVADINADGFPDLIVAPGPKHTPLVKIYAGSVDLNGNIHFTLVKSFYAFSTTFLGGVYVAAGDVNKDGLADVVVSAGAGWLPQVKVYNGQTLLTTDSLIGSPFNALPSTYRGGVIVKVADINNDGYADIIATPVQLTVNLEYDFSGNGLGLLRSGKRLPHG